jgi:ASC-1-like (ASCH) protein
MNQESRSELDDELLEEYDFSKMEGGVRGKYVKQYHEGAKLVMLEADVAKIFPDAKSVNEALRTLSKIVLQHQINT